MSREMVRRENTLVISVSQPVQELRNGLIHHTQGLYTGEDAELAPLYDLACATVQRALDARSHPLVRKSLGVGQDQIPEDFAKICPWFNPDLTDKMLPHGTEIIADPLSILVYSECLDVFETDIGILLDDYIDWNTWNVWNATAWGTDLIISCAGDFRMLDWERRYKLGEFKER
jgi:hypothetical protein